jgi:hypothetical protein
MSDQHNSSAKKNFSKLIVFRQAAYGLMGKAHDALFELTDAVIQMPHIQSFVELSCAPTFRRKWSSAYEALQDGRPNREGLLHLYLQQIADEPCLILAGDHTAWPRLWTTTLPERSYQHQDSPIPVHRPVTIGHGYSTLAIIPESKGSWALPLLHERVSDQRPVEKAAQQLRQVCQQLPIRPITLWDSEYGCAAFLTATADVKADKLIRLRTNLSLEGPTKPYRGSGRYPKHGIKFKFQDPTTWWAPDQIFNQPDAEFGSVTIRVWSGLRFGKALDCHMQVACIERDQAPGTRRKPKLVWFGWVGQEPPDQWWHKYNRRYPIDHWYRFAKGRLHWTIPRLTTLQQSERWSDLMPLITWELWLARPFVQDKPLPWQRPQPLPTPGRVCQSMQNILVAIGTPTRMCKPRGKAPGWPIGRVRTPRKRHSIIYSERWRILRAHQQPVIEGQKPKRGRPKKIQTSATT